jgi:membrane-associated phospholipid phosphatase
VQAIRLNDYGIRWLVVGLIALVALAGCKILRVEIDWYSARGVTIGVIELLIFVLALEAARVIAPRYAHCMDIPADLLLSIIQTAVLIKVFVPVSYIATAAGAHFPLIDATLSQLDMTLFGFNWDASAAWFAVRPAIEWILRVAYNSLVIQAGMLLVIGSVLHPGDRNREFIWAFLVAAVLMSVASPFTPAIGKGTHYMDLLLQIRAGQWHVFSWHGADGVVTFPSFHATLAVLFAYTAFHLHRLAFVVFAPLNALMLVSTPPIGGHYLIDLFGGAVVAVVAIAVIRRMPSKAALTYHSRFFAGICTTAPPVLPASRWRSSRRQLF